MSDIKMCDDNILYCLQTISSFEPDDIECDDFDIAVNDDQFAQMSIVRSAELGVELIDKLTEQVKMLREALHILNEAAEGMIDESVILFVDGGKKLNYDDIFNIVHNALETAK